ncbi:S9 family peptidase [Winogradskyella forsetii]|uniref:S9 family peptidase n=1 Tax=Winogradskyella forsetii TaxID=2686077 RepID=UPI0015CB3C6E|nr:prolyl oligopeptidase family serine peptidase [Winogradskyella forsetii]
MEAQDNTIKDALYTKDLDSMWTKNTYILNMSNDGHWLNLKAFGYKNNEHYFLLNTKTTDTIDIGAIGLHSFSDDSKWFGYQLPQDVFVLINLFTKEKKFFNNVTNSKFDSSARYLALTTVSADNTNILEIIDLQNMSVKKAPNVKSHHWTSKAGVILTHEEQQDLSTLSLRDYNASSETIIEKSVNYTFGSVTINRTASSVLYKREGIDGNTLVNYFIESGKRYDLTQQKLQEVIPESLIARRDMKISDDGLFVFFYRKAAVDTLIERGDMEVWESSAPWIYPRMQQYKKREQSCFLTLWNLKNHTVVPITDKKFPSVRFNANHDHALVYDKLQYEPQYKQHEEIDLYLRNFRTGEVELIVEKQYGEHGFISLSPSGRYISYFKHNFWWIYDSKTKGTTQLRHPLGHPFEMEKVLGATDLKPYGLPGWSEDERYVILYDAYDIWLMEPNGLKKTRITQGSENGITYRISRDQSRNDKEYLNLLNGHTGIVYNLDDGFILEMTDSDFKTGYSLWRDASGLETLYFDDTIVSQVLVRGNLMVFNQGTFNKPPAIIKLNLVDKKDSLLFQSNAKLKTFDLGKREFLTYRNKDGTLLKGLIFYPSHYDPDTDYPMIVKIYENIIKDDLIFKPPTDYEYVGFNLLRYLTNDYFVFIPTISYATGDPGKSILKAIFPAIDSILERYPVDKNRIGLYGHSYGGYETAFLVTQTNFFAAAVAGAAVTNLEQYYHDIGWDWSKAQIWRLEHQQYRMGGSYYKLKERYKRNSPLYYVEHLETPLLLWTGKEDYNVNWTQSTSMFMAMKRLAKPGKLLLFKNESHYLIQPEHQRDLSIETFNWFEYYLKKEEAD